MVPSSGASTRPLGVHLQKQGGASIGGGLLLENIGIYVLYSVFNGIALKQWNISL